MKEINEEVKLTLNLMQTDIDDGAHGELQSHLYSLLEMKRERLSERVYTYTPAQIQIWPDAADDRIDVIGQNGNDGEHYREEMQLGRVLTKHALLRGDWWCADTSEAARHAFAVRGLSVAYQWKLTGLDGCRLTDGENVTRFKGMLKTEGLREITLIDGEFYYCKPQDTGDA